MSVGIVTDSTCYLPNEVVTELGIEVVPLQVISNGVAFNEVGGITVDEVATALRAGKAVTTSRPNPEVFVEAFEKLSRQGHESIVSVHLSSELSGTYESAVLASRKIDFPVDVVDSRGKVHSNPRTYPVFDAKNGQSIGRMNINAFLRKMM